ncbi:AraC family transcriptional regulator [Rhizobium sp. SJZ105]|uniref:AraC family transcriptional regulator n=1 Tax=Rhizobium sp. SJZ105 TaxID=2572678 RepID=UPI00119F7D6A|nr:AraC family transcriptional regulator [Rhizobium sp. SJZ105]TWC76280.1 AraC family transcriptional regulator [Rhizobium sp. SJZ105]
MVALQNNAFKNPDETRRPRYLGEAISPVSGESSDWHTHEFGQLVSAASGSMYVGTRNRVLLLSPAMVVWIPPDVEHWNRYGSNNDMLYVDVNRDEASRLGAESRIMAMTPLLNALMAATLPENLSGRASRHIVALHDLLREELIAAKDVSLSIVMPNDRRIRHFAEAALDDPGRVESVDVWLADAAASRKTIERLFIAETGMPPSRWLRQARILHAVSRLAAGEKVSSVAFSLGYESSSAFAYMFRSTLGMSPSDFSRAADIRRNVANS